MRKDDIKLLVPTSSYLKSFSQLWLVDLNIMKKDYALLIGRLRSSHSLVKNEQIAHPKNKVKRILVTKVVESVNQRLTESMLIDQNIASIRAVHRSRTRSAYQIWYFFLSGSDHFFGPVRSWTCWEKFFYIYFKKEVFIF